MKNFNLITGKKVIDQHFNKSIIKDVLNKWKHQSKYLMTVSVLLASFFNYGNSYADMHNSFFVENVGQIMLEKKPNNGKALFYLNQSAYNQDVVLNKSGFTFMFKNYTPAENLNDERQLPLMDKNKTENITLNFVNTSPDVKVQGVEKRNYYERYYIAGLNGEIAGTYDIVLYEGIYDGIDLKVYPHEQGFKYDFLVSPGADAHNILFEYSGQEQLKVVNGELFAKGANGYIREGKPFSYYIDDHGQKVTVNSSFLIDDNNRITFELGEYPLHKELIIDPEVTYSSYLSRKKTFCPFEFPCNPENTRTTITDIVKIQNEDGDIAVTGWTDYNMMVQLEGTPLINRLNYVTLISGIDGSRLWNIYFGGSGSSSSLFVRNETPSSMDYYHDGDNHMLAIGGWTLGDQSSFPGSWEDDNNDKTNGFLVIVDAFNHSGIGEIVSSKIISGEDNDRVKDVSWYKVDNSLYISVTGDTKSNEQSFPVTTNAFQSVPCGFSTGFLSVYSIDPQNDWEITTDYASFFGAVPQFSPDVSIYAHEIYSVNEERYIAMTGLIEGVGLNTFFPITEGSAFDDMFPYSGYKAFFSVLNIDEGTGGYDQLFYSTYIGGTNVDFGTAISRNELGDFVIGGVTASSNFPENRGTTLQGVNGFLVYFDNAFNFQWGRFLGGSGITGDVINKVALKENALWVYGETSSEDFPLANKLSGVELEGPQDFFLTLLSPEGDDILFSTYYGGGGYEGDVPPLIIRDQFADYLAGGMIAGDCSIWFAGSSTSDANDNSPEYPLVNPDLDVNNRELLGVVTRMSLTETSFEIHATNNAKLPETILSISPFYTDITWYKDGIPFDEYDQGLILWEIENISFNPELLGPGEYVVEATELCGEQATVLAEPVWVTWECENFELLEENGFDLLHELEMFQEFYDSDNDRLVIDVPGNYPVPENNWVSGDIMLKNGVNLTFHSDIGNETTLLMKACSEIKLEYNSILNINNYKLLGCDLWRGIYAPEGGEIIIDNSEIRDAYIGVYSHNNEAINYIRNTIFANNYSHIVIDDEISGQNLSYEVAFNSFLPVKQGSYFDPDYCSGFSSTDYLNTMIFIRGQNGGVFKGNEFVSAPSELLGNSEITAFYGEALGDPFDINLTGPVFEDENSFKGNMYNGYHIFDSWQVTWYDDLFNSEDEPVLYPYFIDGGNNHTIDGSEIHTQFNTAIEITGLESHANNSNSAIRNVVINETTNGAGVHVIGVTHSVGDGIEISDFSIDCADNEMQRTGIYFHDTDFDEIEVSSTDLFNLSSISIANNDYENYGILFNEMNGEKLTIDGLELLIEGDESDNYGIYVFGDIMMNNLEFSKLDMQILGAGVNNYGIYLDNVEGNTLEIADFNMVLTGIETEDFGAISQNGILLQQSDFNNIKIFARDDNSRIELFTYGLFNDVEYNKSYGINITDNEAQVAEISNLEVTFDGNTTFTDVYGLHFYNALGSDLLIQDISVNHPIDESYNYGIYFEKRGINYININNASMEGSGNARHGIYVDDSDANPAANQEFNVDGLIINYENSISDYGVKLRTDNNVFASLFNFEKLDISLINELYTGSSYGIYIEKEVSFPRNNDPVWIKESNIDMHLENGGTLYGIYVNNVRWVHMDDITINMTGANNYGRFYGVHFKDGYFYNLKNLNVESTIPLPLASEFETGPVTNEDKWTTGGHFTNIDHLVLENSEFKNLVNGVEFYKNDFDFYFGMCPNFCINWNPTSRIRNNVFNGNIFGVTIADEEHPSVCDPNAGCNNSETNITDLYLYCNVFENNNVGLFGSGKLYAQLCYDHTGSMIAIDHLNKFAHCINGNCNSINKDWDVLWMNSQSDLVFANLNNYPFSEPNIGGSGQYFLNGVDNFDNPNIVIDPNPPISFTYTINEVYSENNCSYHTYFESSFECLTDNTGKRDVYSVIDKTDFLNKITIFPNPFDQVINIDLEELEGSVISIMLADMKGRKIKRIMHNSEYHLTIKAEDLSNGLYMLIITTDSGEILRELLFKN